MADRPRNTVATSLKWILGLQLAFGALMLSDDLTRVLPNLGRGSDAPELTQPLGPGDQTRRYRPSDISPRAPRPGTRPIPTDTDMPSRLAFQDTVWDARPVITLTGSIAPGDAERFAEFLETALPRADQAMTAEEMIEAARGNGDG